MSVRKKLTILFIVFGSSVFTLGPFLLAPTGQTTREQNSAAGKKDSASDDLEKLKATFPVVEYTYDSINDPVRKARSQKYGSIKSVDPNITADAMEMIMRDWEVGLPALPAVQSQVIVLGTVDSAKAFLSDNKASVYSEFGIQIDTIFKNETSFELKPKGHISAEREGGIVRFPTGVEKWLSVGGQRMPTPQNTYLFFLTFDVPYGPRQKNDLYILTAYQLLDGRVVPLDHPGGGTHPIAKQYRAKEKAELLRDLQNALAPKSRAGGAP